MSAPDLRHHCECGHVVGQHTTGAPRGCSVTDCDCAAYLRVPPALCQTCGHLASLHAAQRDAGSGRCCAGGCRCPGWARRGSAVPASTSAAPGAGQAPIEVTTATRTTIRIPTPCSGGRVRMRFTPDGAAEFFVSGGRS